MTTPTPASGTRHAVSVKTAFIGQTGIAYPNENPIYGDGTRQKCHVVSGYTGSVKSLKRLAEIAAMDELTITNIFWTEYNRSRLTNDPNSCAFMGLKAMLQALGLSPKNSKKAGRKLK